MAHRNLRIVVDNVRYPPPPIEHTVQGPQSVIPGAERSARQAAAAREAAGHGKIKPRTPQRAPGGLFEPAEPLQPSLFE